MTDPAARKAFPIVDRIIRGQGDLLMTAAVRRQHGKWVAALPGH
jgi:hypothetical protein